MTLHLKGTAADLIDFDLIETSTRACRLHALVGRRRLTVLLLPRPQDVPLLNEISRPL